MHTTSLEFDRELERGREREGGVNNLGMTGVNVAVGSSDWQRGRLGLQRLVNVL